MLGPVCRRASSVGSACAGSIQRRRGLGKSRRPCDKAVTGPALLSEPPRPPVGAASMGSSLSSSALVPPALASGPDAAAPMPGQRAAARLAGGELALGGVLLASISRQLANSEG